MKMLAMMMLPLLAVAAAGQAVAADQKAAKVDVAAFADSRARIERALSDKDAYSELSARQRADVMQALDRMGSTLARVNSVSELNGDDKVQLFNDQEMVNSVLTQAADDSRLVCRQDTKTGSHRRITQCRTVAQIRREREEGQETARRVQAPTMRAPAGG